MRPGDQLPLLDEIGEWQRRALQAEAALAFDNQTTLGERARRAWAAYCAQQKGNNLGTTWESLGPEHQACWMAAAAAAMSR